MGEESLAGHIPKSICKSVSMFLTLSHCYMKTEAVGKRVNLGDGYGLEIPVLYLFFFLSCEAIDYLKKEIRNSPKRA